MTKRIVLVLLVFLVFTGGMMAQQSNSRITGKVTDEEGSGLPGVSVTAVSPKMVGQAETISDENGIYRLLNLVPGTYRITYMLEGFQTVVREGIQISVEQTLDLPVQMSSAASRKKSPLPARPP